MRRWLWSTGILFAAFTSVPNVSATHYLGHGVAQQPSVRQINESCNKHCPEIKQSPQYSAQQK